MTNPGTTWVVGSNGLLGRAVVRSLHSRGAVVLTTEVPWGEPERAHDALVASFTALLRVSQGDQWNIAWCAGAGVTSTPAVKFEAEIATLSRFVTHVLTQSRTVTERGAVFLASSAGGIYAGSTEPPFSEDSTPSPLSAYGAAKLRAEREIARLALEGGVRVLVGRISNLYGPGQDLSKAQGLISQICRAQFTAQPIAVYVSLDTIRDYLFVDDAAAMVNDGLEQVRARIAQRPEPPVITKILASQRSVSIAGVLGETRRIFKRQPLLRLAASPNARQQARDLRFHSVVWPELDSRALTTLSTGIMTTLADIGRRIRVGELADSPTRRA